MQTVNVFSRLSELSRRETIDKVEKLVTYALQTVFDDSYNFFITDKEQKNSVIYAFMMQNDGQPPYPVKENAAGGERNIVGAFLGIIVSILQNPNQRRFFGLDERFKHVSREHQTRIAKVLRSFADKLDCQLLLSSHKDEMLEIADKAYYLKKRNGKTAVKELIHGKQDLVGPAASFSG